jgi:hypothetical protein
MSVVNRIAGNRDLVLKPQSQVFAPTSPLSLPIDKCDDAAAHSQTRIASNARSIWRWVQSETGESPVVTIRSCLN